MKLKLNRISLKLDYITVAFVCGAIIISGDSRFITALLSTAAHEAGHILVMLKSGDDEIEIEINLFNIAINDKHRNLRSYKSDIEVICAGPLVNLILFLIFFVLYSAFGSEFLYNTAMLNLVLGLFNLLPMESTDGGQLMYIILSRIFSVEKTKKFITLISIVTIIPIAFIGFYVLLNSKYNYTLLFAALYLAMLVLMKKSKYV